MGFFRAHHKKKGKMECSKWPATPPKGLTFTGYPEERIIRKYQNLLANWDKGKCCDTDSCNDGKGNCNGSCNR